MATSKRPVADIAFNRDKFFRVGGVEFRYKKVTVEEFSKIQEVQKLFNDPDNESRDVIGQRAEIIYDCLKTRYVEGQEEEMFDLDFFLEAAEMDNLNDIQALLLLGEEELRNSKKTSSRQTSTKK